MELVFTRKDKDGTVMAAEYGGVDLSVLGETYLVKKVGSRSVVNVPLSAVHLLGPHGFMPVGEANAEMVDSAAKEALRAQAAADDAAIDAAAAKEAKANAKK